MINQLGASVRKLDPLSLSRRLPPGMGLSPSHGLGKKAQYPQSIPSGEAKRKLCYFYHLCEGASLLLSFESRL